MIRRCVVMMLGQRRGGEEGEAPSYYVGIVQLSRFQMLFEFLEDLVGGGIVFGDGGEIGERDGNFSIVSFESVSS